VWSKNWNCGKDGELSIPVASETRFERIGR
jgi:hypothetical protein